MRWDWGLEALKFWGENETQQVARIKLTESGIFEAKNDPYCVNFVRTALAG